jgi:hypothetical protein
LCLLQLLLLVAVPASTRRQKARACHHWPRIVKLQREVHTAKAAGHLQGCTWASSSRSQGQQLQHYI